MNKRILVTGANGFVGENLMKVLINADYEVITLVRKRSGLKNEVIIDFCDSGFSSVIESLPCVDAIVHLGAKVGWDDSSKQQLFIPNVFATAELVKWANKINAYFIFASAAIVCGVKNEHIQSDTKSDPDTNYGYSKWLAEELIRFSEVKHCILRISGIFGKNGPAHLGINKAIREALSAEAPKIYGEGLMKRNYIYVNDLAEAIKFCLEHEVTGTHLVAGSQINTIADMIQTICEVILEGKKPSHLDGKSGSDQVVEKSSVLPATRSFREAIKNINNEDRNICGYPR